MKIKPRFFTIWVDLRQGNCEDKTCLENQRMFYLQNLGPNFYPDHSWLFIQSKITPKLLDQLLTETYQVKERYTFQILEQNI